MRAPGATVGSGSCPGGGNTFGVYEVGPDGVFKSWTGKVAAGNRLFHGQRGKFYWFWASVTTDLGWKDANGSQVVKFANDSRTQLKAVFAWTLISIGLDS